MSARPVCFAVTGQHMFFFLSNYDHCTIAPQRLQPCLFFGSTPSGQVDSSWKEGFLFRFRGGVHELYPLFSLPVPAESVTPLQLSIIIHLVCWCENFTNLTTLGVVSSWFLACVHSLLLPSAATTTFPTFVPLPKLQLITLVKVVVAPVAPVAVLLLLLHYISPRPTLRLHHRWKKI